jgi:hypothetical protein
MSEPMTLTGMFFILHGDDVFFTGEVIGEPTPGKYLVRIDGKDRSIVSPMELVCADEMAHSERDGVKSWEFFATRDDLQAWRKWLDEPESDARPKIVRLRKPEGAK